MAPANPRSSLRLCMLNGLAALLAGTGLAQAQDAGAFFAGRNLRIVIGHSAGGDYDQGTRLLARHLGAHLPGNPNVVVQNMPGAASVVAANFLYEAAPADGSVLGSFSRNLPASQLRGLRNLKAVFASFHWLGAYSAPGRICVASKSSNIRSAQDLRSRELLVGGTGAGSMVTIIPHVLKNLMGLNFKIVEGYKGLPEIMLAIERGEVNGICVPADYITTSHENLIREGRLNVLFSTEETPLVEFPTAPSIYSETSNESERQMMRLLFSGAEFGRPYVYPPNVPAHLVAAMRDAFSKVASNPAMLAEARKSKLDVSFTPHTELEKRLAALAATPAATLEKAKILMPVK